VVGKGKRERRRSPVSLEESGEPTKLFPLSKKVVREGGFVQSREEEGGEGNMP
jgi:hypothetical protein